MADVAEPLLDGRPHLLLHDVDVVVVEPEVAAAVLDEAPPHRQDVRLVRLQHLPHQALRQLVLALPQPLLQPRPETKEIDIQLCDE